MKRIFVIIACAALMMACGGNKAQNKECEECKTECNEKKECNGQECDKQECTQQTAGCIHLDTEGFTTKVADLTKEWKYLGDKPAIIDFYASWCGPCKMVAPILEELAEEYGDSIVIYKVNTEKERELSSAFGIRSIPTLIFVPMGENPQVVQGAMGKADFRKVIDEVLLKK